MQCNAFVRGVTRRIDLEYSASNKLYKMSEELDNYIVRYGALSV